MSAKVRQRTTHADEVIDHDVIDTRGYRTIEAGLSSQAGKTIGAGMRHHVGLNHAIVDLPAKFAGHHVSQYFRYRIHAFAFVGMGTDQHRMPVAHQGSKPRRQVWIEHITHQFERRNGIAALGRWVAWVLLDPRLVGMNQHIRKFAPGATWWFHGPDASTGHDIRRGYAGCAELAPHQGESLTVFVPCRS